MVYIDTQYYTAETTTSRSPVENDFRYNLSFDTICSHEGTLRWKGKKKKNPKYLRMAFCNCVDRSPELGQLAEMTPRDSRSPMENDFLYNLSSDTI